MAFGRDGSVSMMARTSFIIATIATITYSILLVFVILFPKVLAPFAISWLADSWADIGCYYLVAQSLAVVLRPVHKDVYEYTDHISSFVPAAIVFVAAPMVWYSSEWPGWDIFKIWRTSMPVAMVDIILTLVSLKISRMASRITPA